jgi:DNA adenine methylase
MVRPVLKWAGGKRQLLTEIRQRIPRSYDQYHEPFLGGGAVFFELCPEVGTVNDRNATLVNFYTVVRDSPQALIRENHRHEYEREYYETVRDEFNELKLSDETTAEEQIREASLFLYLNRTGFNGLYRENASGEFNVPFGEHRNPNFVMADRIQTASRVLESVEIFNCDFEYVLDHATAGDLVYFDPPYQPMSRTADFTEYQADGFDRDDQRRLRDVAVDLDRRGAFVIASNSPPVAELFEETPFTIEYVDASRRINSDSDGRGDVAELLMSNVDIENQQQSTIGEFETNDD